MLFATAGPHPVLSGSIYMKEGVEVPMTSLGVGRFLNVNVEVW